MYVVSSFEQTAYLEMAISDLQQKGIPKEHILAVPLDKRSEPRKLMDTLHYSDGASLFDGTALTATALGALGVMIGYGLYWGPIAWGLIGFIAGGLIGYATDYLINKRRFRTSRDNAPASEVILTVYCSTEEARMVEENLWEHFARGVGRLDR